MGNFYHNCYVLSREGVLLIGRRIHKEILKANDCVPCCNCLVSYQRSNLWTHQETCLYKGDQVVKYRSAQSIGKLLATGAGGKHSDKELSQEYEKYTTGALAQDKIARIVKK